MRYLNKHDQRQIAFIIVRASAHLDRWDRQELIENTALEIERSNDLRRPAHVPLVDARIFREAAAEHLLREQEARDKEEECKWTSGR